MITHLVPDILECEVEWPLGSITMNRASGGDGIPAVLLQILKYNAVKVLHSICQKIWETQQWPQEWKGSVFIPIPKKDNAKGCSNYRTIALISHASKVLACKIKYCNFAHITQNPSSQASTVPEPRTSRCTSWIQKRQRNQRSNFQNLLDHQKSKRVPEKHLFLLY